MNATVLHLPVSSSHDLDHSSESFVLIPSLCNWIMQGTCNLDNSSRTPASHTAFQQTFVRSAGGKAARVRITAKGLA